MLNTKNVKSAIKTMQRAKNFHLATWQDNKNFRATDGVSILIVGTLEQLYLIGSTACVGGYIALSTDFKKDGGTIGQQGQPVYKNLAESKAVAEWLGIPKELAAELCGCYVSESGYSVFYELYADYITPHHVIQKLQEMLNGTLS